RLELVEGTDARLGVEQRHGFRPHALQAEQIQNRRRALLEEIAVIANLARLGDLADLRGELLADAGDGSKLFLGAVAQLLCGVGNGLGGVSIGAYLERVL